MLKHTIAHLIPLRWQVPARYWRRRLLRVNNAELLHLLAAVRPGSTVIDVGANVGAYSYPLSKVAAVHAFEPIPACVRMLEAFARPHPRLHVHGVALSDAAGEATLHIPYRDGHPVTAWASIHQPHAPHETIVVPVRTLDSYGFSDVSVIKIDVEGHELSVLNGAHQTIQREKPTLLIEIEQRHHDHDIRPYFSHMQDLGFAGHFFFKKRLTPIAEFDPATHQDPRRADRVDGTYVADFLFTPAPR